MRIKNLSSSFKCNISKQSKKVLRLFVLIKLRKPVFLRAHQIRRSAKKPASHEGHHSKLVSFFRCSRPNRDMDRVTELKSFSERSHQKAPCPSPITPAYIRMGEARATTKRGVAVVSEKDDNEDACRSFEKYLVEMIVEDGKMRDLVDDLGRISSVPCSSTWSVDSTGSCVETCFLTAVKLISKYPKTCKIEFGLIF